MNKPEMIEISPVELERYLGSGKSVMVECKFWLARSVISIMPNTTRTVAVKSGDRICHCALSGYGKLWKAYVQAGHEE